MTQHCMGYGISAQGAGGTEAYIELWNPATTTVVLRVTRIVINTKDTVVKVKYHTAKQGSTALAKGNKSLGGSAPAGELYGNNAASVSGTQVGSLICTVDADREVDLTGEPILVYPGKSLILENTDAAEAITNCELHWDEIQLPGVVA
jgi:hypothetical protein